MKKILLTLIAAIFAVACNTQTKEKKATTEPEQKVEEKAEETVGRKNFAVVWEWAGSDKKLVEDNITDIISEFDRYWKKDIIENAYYDTEAKLNKFENFPNIAFFLKADSKENAQDILNNMLIKKMGIANYRLHPVGTKWLGRKSEVINKKGVTRSFVAVWETNKEIDPTKDATILKEQYDKVLELNNNGSLENIYWELSGEPDANKRAANDITDFVFFVNADSEEAARKICDELPLTKEGFVSYKMLSVGVFWLGNSPE